MRFVVPQFIDVEDKIIGPFSVRQFIIFLAGGGILFILYNIFNFIIFIILGVFVFALTGISAFAKINGQLFHYFMLNIFYTTRRPRLKIWKKEVTAEEITKAHREKTVKAVKVVPAKKMITSSKLAHLSLVVDTGGAYKEEEDLEIKA